MPRDEKARSRYLDSAILQKIGSLELIAREVVEGLRVGMHDSPLRGFSTEFAHHRPYVAGDEARHIDWRIYARTARYYVKLFEAETNFDANLLLDASGSMRYRSGAVSKLEYAKFMAASLAFIIAEQRDSVGLAVFDAELRRYIEPKGGKGIIRTIAEELEAADAHPRTDIASLLHEFARRLPRRGVVILFSDLLDHVDEFLRGLDHLRFRGHEVTVFHILDPYELRFPFRGMWRFDGLEEEPAIATQPRRIRAAYLEELAAYLQSIRTACDRSHVDYVLVDTSRPVDVVLAGYLLGRVRRTMGTSGARRRPR
ncbi:MAG: DUF58 domain-containing protein [Planctomycetes bacterium]|nr:DUF58 domain-containing protein [Planctomycetota bacterium]